MRMGKLKIGNVRKRLRPCFGHGTEDSNVSPRGIKCMLTYTVWKAIVRDHLES